MNKSGLKRFIQKYNLNGNVNSVRWKSSDNKLITSFVTPDKTLLGTVSMDGFNFESTELGVYYTDQLQKLLGVVGDTVDLNLTKVDERAVSMNVTDGGVSVDFVLSDLSVISEPPTLKRLPEFTTSIKVDAKFIDTFIKGVSSLSDVDTFSIINKNGDCSVVIGYSKTNTNRVTIPVECENCELTDVISFDANLFKEVLVANKECTSATLEVSNEGLARIGFKVDEYDSLYHIVQSRSV